MPEKTQPAQILSWDQYKHAWAMAVQTAMEDPRVEATNVTIDRHLFKPLFEALNQELATAFQTTARHINIAGLKVGAEGLMHAIIQNAKNVIGPDYYAHLIFHDGQAWGEHDCIIAVAPVTLDSLGIMDGKDSRLFSGTSWGAALDALETAFSDASTNPVQ